MNKFKTLAGKVRRKQRQSGQILAGVRQARYESRHERIGHNHYDRDRPGSFLGQLGNGSNARDEDIDRLLDQRANGRLRSLLIAVREEGFKCNVATFDIAKLGQTLAQIRDLTTRRR